RDLLLAGARARSLQPCARLDGEVRVRSEGLAQDRPDLPMSLSSNVILSAAKDPCAPRRNSSARLRGPSRFALRMTILACAAAPLAAQGGGNGTLYIGTYGRQILVMDEATMKVKDSIKTSIGVPRLSLSFDRKHIYAADPGYEKV